MNVGVALHYVRNGKITGVERVGLSLLEGFEVLSPPDVRIHVLASQTAARRLAGHTGTLVTALPGDWRLVAEQCVLPIWTRTRQLDILHVPAFGGALLQRHPFVLTVHDAVYWDMPTKLSKLGALYYRPLVERALRSPSLRAALFPSAAARDAVLRHFPALSRTAHVCHNASAFPVADAPRRWGARRDGLFRILTVGTLEPRKNLAGMASAITELSRLLRTPVQWQLVGRKGWLTADDERALRHPAAEWLGVVTDEELLELYRGADLFLSLSHMEGFNIPLIEAISQGTPALVSDLPVHHEVGEDGARYVRSGESLLVAEQMHELLVSAGAWEAASEAGRVRGAAFSPRSLAERTVSLYRSVVKAG